MKLFVRADSSVEIGTGHIMRCLALTDALRDRGAEVEFVCRSLPGDAGALVAGKGYKVHRLPLGADASWQDDAGATLAVLRASGGCADWLVVDHYRLDLAWERSMRQCARHVMVIDDLADRRHDCDLLLDQNYYPDAEKRYLGLLPAGCQLFLGPRHALLRTEFRTARSTLRTRDGRVERLLVFFGGTDPSNETAKALEALASMGGRSFASDVVVGGGNPQRAAIQAACRVLPGVSYHCQVDNMAQLIADADLALGAGGAATWERCYLGLPSITVITATNQRETTAALEQAGATWNLGWHAKVTAAMMAQALLRGCREPEALLEMGRCAGEIMGGWGDGRQGAGEQNTLLDAMGQHETTALVAG